MRIGIDARLIDETGVGRYIRNLIRELGVQDRENTYVVYLRRPQLEAFSPPNGRWIKKEMKSRWHTLWEQFEMPFVFLRDKLDVVHVPYFTAPVFYQGKYVLTIHDLIVLSVTTGKASTLPFPLYLLKKIGYEFVLRMGVKRAWRILTVSETVKSELMARLEVLEEKITVAHEGVDRHILQQRKRLILEPYFLTVGNAYPHKNLEGLVGAFLRYVKQTSDGQTQLVLVGREDMFYGRLKKWVATLEGAERIRFFGPADDTQLGSLYSHAIGLVQPSLAEGFGLPPLEALSLGTPVLVNDIPIFHEILGDLAEYADAEKEVVLADALGQMVRNKVRRAQLAKKANTLIARKYSWERMARETLKAYQSVVRTH